ncbi:hypothetical protein BDZ45DRAFT_726154 [Acephala macrosclerotiorum]|nr:hypothetical protein BDZ45DRAFT_726154 [Acephala macrosclerotiorum]
MFTVSNFKEPAGLRSHLSRMHIGLWISGGKSDAFLRKGERGRRQRMISTLDEMIASLAMACINGILSARPIIKDIRLHYTVARHSKAEMAVVAMAGVYAGGRLMRGMKDKKEVDHGDMKAHFVRAAIGAAVAVGALEMMRKEKKHLSDNHQGTEHEGSESESDEDPVDSTALAPGRGEKGAQQTRQHHHHDTVKLIQDSAAAYRLGRNVMGNRDHSIVLLIAEALGALGLLNSKGSTV